MKKHISSSIICLLFLIGIFPFNVAGQLPVKGIVLLVDFSDSPSVLTPDHVHNLMNVEDYTEPNVTSSIRDYWMQQSRDSIELTHEIFGYYRATETAAWYAEQEWTIVRQLVKDALDSVVAQNPDYDWDNLTNCFAPGLEHTFLSVNLVTTTSVAGSGGTHWLGDWIAPNGTTVGRFTSQTLTDYWDESIVRLFTIAHEIGHAAWQLPDTYDYDGSSFGTGFYSVMSGNQIGGDVEPIGGPFFANLAWVDIIDIEANSTYILPEDGEAVARYVNPSNPNEYFIIEACANSTPGNAAFPVERGLLIWHVDEDVTTGNNLENMTLEEHYAYSIEQADGLFELENGVNQGNAGDIYVEGSLFSSTTVPNSNWWDATDSGLDINQIQFLDDGRIQFCNGLCDLSIDSEKGKKSIQIYAAEQNIIVKFNSLPADEYTLNVLNAEGKLILKDNFHVKENEIVSTKKIDLSNQAAGIFIVSISNSTSGLIRQEKVMSH